MDNLIDRVLIAVIRLFFRAWSGLAFMGGGWVLPGNRGSRMVKWMTKYFWLGRIILFGFFGLFFVWILSIFVGRVQRILLFFEIKETRPYVFVEQGLIVLVFFFSLFKCPAISLFLNWLGRWVFGREFIFGANARIINMLCNIFDS